MPYKIITFIILFTHLSGSFASAAAGVGVFDACAGEMAVIGVDSDTAAIIAIVNKNLCRQVKLISDLADFSCQAAGKALPRHKKDKPARDASPRFLMPAGALSQLKQFNPAAAADMSYAPVAPIAIPPAIFALVIFLFVRQRKFKRLFYCLARGAIEDAIFLFPISAKNPHRRNAAEGFLLEINYD